MLMWVGCILLRGDKWVKVFPSTQLDGKTLTQQNNALNSKIIKCLVS
jgi:hypothetical protein